MVSGRSLFIAFAFLIVGCSSSAGDGNASDILDTSTSTAESPIADEPPPFDGPSVDGPLILSFPRFDSEEAQILGVVEVEDDGCVTIDGSVAVWPPGTSWDEANESIVLPDGSIVANGDSVEGGGGYQPPSNLEFFVNDEGAEAVMGCIADRSNEIAVFNSEADSVTRS